MKKKVFSLVELIVSVVIIGIVSTTGYVGYKSVMENAKDKVCATNEKIIFETLKIYALEKNVLPGSLGSVPSQYYEKAYAKVLNNEKNQLLIKTAYFLIDSRRKGFIRKVFAQGLLDIGLKAEVLDCPKDKTPYSAGGISYGMAASLVNASLADFKNFEGVVVACCETATFGSLPELADRHGFITKKANGIKKETGSMKGKKGHKRDDDDTWHDD